MKATKLLAVLLAVLMVIPAMVMPTAAADATAANAAADPYALKYEFTQFEASETPYFVQHGAGKDSASDWDGRNGEDNGTIWKFPLSNPSQMENAINKLTKFTVTAKTRNEVVLLLSLDNVNYTEVYSILTDPNLKVDDSRWCLNPAVRTYDFTDELYALLKTNPEAEYVYLKLSDALKGEVSVNGDYTAVDGYGGCFIKNTPVVVEINYDKDTCWAYDQFVFTPGQDDETQYRYDASKTFSNDATGWFLDEKSNSKGTKFIQWVYELTDSALPETLTWSATVGQNILLEFSVDNKNWNTFFKEVPGNASNLKFYSFDITEAYLNARAASPSNMLYVRMSNSKPGFGYGGKINFAPATLTAGYEKQLPSGDFITLDWTVQGEDENLYWAGGASPKIGYYYADKGALGVVRYPITNADLSGEILFTAKVGSQFLLKVSLDGVNYVDAFIYNNAGVWETDKSSCKGFATTYRTFDLAAAVKEAAKVADSKDNLYVAFGDSEPSSGNGGQLHGDVTLNIRSAEGMKYGFAVQKDIVNNYKPNNAENPTAWSLTKNEPMLVTTAEGAVSVATPKGLSSKEAGLLTKNADGTYTFAGSGTYHGRGADDEESFVYRYAVPSNATSFVWTARMGGDYGIKLATGGKTLPNQADDSLWTVVDDFQTDGFTASHSGTTIDNTVEVDLTDYDLSGGYIYLWFVDYDYVKDGTGGGWGPRVMFGTNYPITMTYYVSTENELCNTTEIAYVPYAHTVKESFTLNQVVMGSTYVADNGPDGEKGTEDDVLDNYYAITGKEPVYVAGGTLTNNLKKGSFDLETMTLAGDGNWNGRYTDGGYTIYRYELPKYATAFDWKVRMGGDYGVYIMYANEAPAAESEDWIPVKNFLEDGYKITAVASEHPGAKDMTISQTIPADNTAKYVYIMFCDYDYRLYPDGYTPEGSEEVIKTSGYGARVALGSNYSVDMIWTVSGEDRDVAYSVSSAQLTLTENFNLNFKLNLPVSSKGDENVTITWADGKPVEKMAKVDGGYEVKDILPQDMAKDLVVTFSGTCMDNTKYTSKTFTYSVKDYCMRMISKNPTDAKLVALLSDALVYGAAAQKYVFDDGELATDGVVGLKPSTFTAPDKAAYENVLSRQATAEDAYKWAGVTLVLDNTVAIRYTLYTEAAAPTVMVNGKAYTPVAADEANYYYVDVPVYAGKFATEYVASFDGVEGYTVTYSVNHYVARNYDASQKLTSALIAALYNYGASAVSYVAK